MIFDLAALAQWALKYLSWLIVAALGTVIVGFIAWKVFLSGDAARIAATTAKAQATIRAAADASAHQAIETLQSNAAAVAAAQDLTRTNHVHHRSSARRVGACFRCCGCCRPSCCLPAQVRRRSS